MGRKLKLRAWSNSKDATIEELKNLGSKIVSVRKSRSGHLITYIHPTLTRRPRKGDLVEYIDCGGKRHRGIVKGTEDDWYCLKDHVDVKDHIMDLGNVSKIITKQLIPEKLFKYL